MKSVGYLLVCLAASLSYELAHGFASDIAFGRSTKIKQTSWLPMSTTEESAVAVLNDKGLLKRDRYVATNRFAVRKGKAPKMEQRWATRKSRLSVLEGFKYFQLMRRVTLNDDGTCTYDEGDTEEAAFENYVSFTIWNKKSDFSAWRNGEAFKEAHGGTSIGAFLSTMVNSAFVLRGPPRPAFYDSLFLQSTKPTEMPKIVDGWRNVEADGTNTLPAESFVQMEKFYVPSGEKAIEFEKFWADNNAKMEEFDGFVAGSLLRRDGQAKGHGIKPMEPTEPTYVATAIFKDRSSFNSWAAAVKNAPVPPSQSRPSAKEYYEGILVIPNPDGA